MTDASLAQLKDMPILRILLLEDTKVTDAGLVHLKDLPSLTNLWIGGKTTDVSLAGVRTLWLTDTRPPGADRANPIEMHCAISDAGLVHLEALTGLRWLRLDNTSVTDAGLARLRGLTGLQFLALVRARITDDGLAHLKGLAGLHTLGLSGNAIATPGCFTSRPEQTCKYDPAQKITRPTEPPCSRPSMRWLS